MCTTIVVLFVRFCFFGGSHRVMLRSYLGITPDSALGIIWDAQDQTWISGMPSKHPIYYTVSLGPQHGFKVWLWRAQCQVYSMMNKHLETWFLKTTGNLISKFISTYIIPIFGEGTPIKFGSRGWHVRVGSAGGKVLPAIQLGALGMVCKPTFLFSQLSSLSAPLNLRFPKTTQNSVPLFHSGRNCGEGRENVP